MYTIYTRGNCELCEMAKRFCRENNVPFREVYLLTENDIATIKSTLPDDIKSGRVALPIVFDENLQYIGGRDDLIIDYTTKMRSNNLFDGTEDMVNQPFTKDAMYNLLRNHICNVVFTKVNGDERKMRCTLMETKLPEGVSVGKSDSHHGGFLAVYDLDSEGWRGFRIDSIKSVNIEV